MAGEMLLDIQSLGVSIGASRVLDRISLQVARDEILGLVGASGSGKSMTALAIMRLLPLAARVTGSVCFEDRLLGAMSDAELRAVRGGRIGMIFQEPMTALNPLIRIGDQVAETVRLHSSAGAAEAKSLAREALDRVGLHGIEPDRLPYELSGGQRQRVAIAMALVLAPALVIADEPTTALDVGTQADVLRLLEESVRARGSGMILVSHDLAVIAQLTDRIAFMRHGTIIEQLPTAELLTREHHPYTEALLAAARLEPKRAPRRAGAAPVLEARDIVREYPRRRSFVRRSAPRRAVDGVSLEVHAGETVGLVGESGSGKSSLLRALLALERPQAGAVRLLGEDFGAARGAALRRLRRSIQVVLQDPVGSFDPRWRVERLVAEPL